MKFFILLMLSFASADEFAPHYGRIQSQDILDKGPSACIRVPNDSNQTIGTLLVLGNCRNRTDGWRLDMQGMIHSELDEDLCIQAGHTEEEEDSSVLPTVSDSTSNSNSNAMKAHEGARLRLEECSIHQPLQRFAYNPHFGWTALHSASNRDLCVTWEGETPDIGTDTLVLAPCRTLQHSKHWIGGFAEQTTLQKKREREEKELRDSGILLGLGLLVVAFFFGTCCLLMVRKRRRAIDEVHTELPERGFQDDDDLEENRLPEVS